MANHEELRSASRQALVAGGGSGGHVFPGLALAVALERRGWAVSFIGRPGQIEETLATERGMPFLPLAAAPLVGTSLWQKARTAVTTLRSAGAGARLVRRTGADVVVGLGGYVSVPAVLGAKLSGRPILLFEPNAAPGVANRFLSRFASEAAVAYREAGDSLSCPVTVTGTPVLPGFFEQSASPTKPEQLLVLGGSQGAQQINRLMPEALAALGDEAAGLRVLHQAGASHAEATQAAYRDAGAIAASVEVVPFIDDVAAALGASGLVVSRAGAITLSEICAVGRPALLIPLPIAGGHQIDNAEALVAAGAASILPQDATGHDLAERLRDLLGDEDSLAAMGQAAQGASRRDAAEAMADRVVALGGAG
jgi:UDP-N-acetylglucosamine--N-acetylmuramyl-(pentapeptide) pyrophosphoryl-undecaprenol N-acetylglucosamine transferase